MTFEYKEFLKKRFERKIFTGLPLTIFIIVFLILLATFLGITDSIVNSYPIVKIDDNFAHALYQIRTPAMAKFFFLITHFADQATMALLILAGMIYLYFKKEVAYLYSLILVAIGAEGSALFIKILISRARPGADIAYYLENSKSFPSGHSTMAMAFYGFLIYYLINHIPSRQMRYLIIILGAILIAAIGFSRLYLGVHFLSDVLGGYLLGALWLVAGITFRERHFYVSNLNKGKTPLK